MTTQEQEHWDHEAGRATEAQNCLSEARIDLAHLNAKADAKIAQALDKNLFVVVSEGPYLCRATDALAGVVRTFESAFGNREKAQSLVDFIVNATQGEHHVFVLPRLPDENQELAALWANRPQADDLPF